MVARSRAGGNSCEIRLCTSRGAREGLDDGAYHDLFLAAEKTSHGVPSACYTSNCVGEEEVNHIIAALKNDGLVFDDQGALRWRDFPVKPNNANQQLTEKKDGSATTDTVLGTIINAVAKVPLPNLSASCRYEEEPYASKSELSGSQHHIDGCLQLINSMSPPAPKGSKALTSDIAVGFVYKCDSEKPAFECIINNRWKALDSAIHTLHLDCQRKHTYSITIEDNYMSLWYFSRSHSAKSHEFDMLVSVRLRASGCPCCCTRAFLSDFFTVEDLGYDGNIRQNSEWDQEAKEDRIRYVYRLDGRFFKTLECRDEYHDQFIVGRATRVWEVVEVVGFDDIAALSNAQRMILRDVWLEHGSDTEREIQKKIFERCDALARDFPSENDARLKDVDDATRTILHQRLKDGSFKQLFLTIEADYRGAVSKPRAEGFKPALHVFDEPGYYLNQEARAQTGVPREYNPKQRNFVVYQEVCLALHELGDLYDVVQALLDALLALQILFLVSWIHRDVSSGNILSFEGRGKLSDLEYAKEFNLSTGWRSADPKTCTPIFMAVEVYSGLNIYIEAPDLVESEDSDQPDDPAPSRRAIRHKFQHDLESIFWVLIWLVFTHIPGQDRAGKTKALFHSKHPHFYMIRWHFLIDTGFCAENLESLRPELPSQIRRGLRKLRAILQSYYLSRGNSVGDVSTYSPIYGLFRDVLQTIATSVPRGTVRLERPPPPR
ncbi:hypothetical protein NUW54_g9526 [Trametes sanguinea]|uniref:Uncharacterized protein n=1 Tax=Trametes sanguinea TaxID=158606 RepID=A0ACC1P6E9_9APHY|nr:hypothetical protein NUW54_g9526 [Trametes sanguinea]